MVRVVVTVKYSLRVRVRVRVLVGSLLGPARGGRTQEQGVQQQGQVDGPVCSDAVVHHHLRHEEHGDVTPVTEKTKDEASHE